MGYLDHSLVDADVGVGLEVDPVMLLQRKRRRPRPRCWGLTGGDGRGGGGEARPAACEWGVAVEVRRQHGELVSERGRDSNWRENSERNVLPSALLSRNGSAACLLSCPGGFGTKTVKTARNKCTKCRQCNIIP